MLDEEINDCIDACYKDLAVHGISVYTTQKQVKATIVSDPLIIACQKLYARWQFNFENSAERYERAYTQLRDGLSLSGDYR